MALSFIKRDATTTNSVGHSYNAGVYTSTRFDSDADLSAWDGVSSINKNGTTADGSIVATWSEGDTLPEIIAE